MNILLTSAGELLFIIVSIIGFPILLIFKLCMLTIRFIRYSHHALMGLRSAKPQRKQVLYRFPGLELHA